MNCRLIITLLATLFMCETIAAGEVADGDSAVVAGNVADGDSTVVAKKPAKKKYGLVRRTIRGFDKLDTAYIEPQRYTYTVMMQMTHSYERYTLRASGRHAQSMTFAPDINMKVGPYFGWKWFFAGYTFDLKHLSLNDIKQEFDFSVYSSQIGFDLFYRRTGSEYKLRNAHLGDNIDVSSLDGVPFDGVKAGITGFNLYYIFNHGRFSYPAAFAQSTRQKVSCGSWMAGIGYTKHSIELDYDRLQHLIDDRLGANTVALDSGLMFNSVRYYDFSLSGGYAYNWVFAHNWLFGASIQAALGHKRSVGDVDGTNSEGFSFRNVNIDGIGRFGLVYNNMRWYAGASVILHTYNYRKSRFSTNDTFGSLNIYSGYNFGLKKKYRKKKQ